MDALAHFWTSASLLQTIMMICIVSGIGLFLGKVKLGRFALGSACVFFVGILFAHFGAKVNEEMLAFGQNFGLILFVYTLGIQVGPGFVASFKSKGIPLNAWGAALILLATVAVVAMHYLTPFDIAQLMGVLSGAVTNTPALGAAQQAVTQSLPSVSSTLLSDMALATAITYPFGIIGVILVLVVLKQLFPHRDVAVQGDEPHHFVGEYYVRNPEIHLKSVGTLHTLLQTDFIISRLWRKGKVIQPTSDTLLENDDHLIIVSDEAEVPRISAFIGGRATESNQVDWEAEDRELHLVSRRLLITKSEFNGVKLASLRIRNRYGVNVTRITRSEMDLVPTPTLRLQIGDRLTVVGRNEDIETLAERIGDQLRPLDTPYLVSIFLGIFLGCALGSLPIFIPGISTPIKLGIAGGPIIVGILMGAYGPRLRLNTYITQSANLMVRTMGIVIYLACLGITSGADFFATLTNGEGLLWMGIGALLTVVPTFVIGALALRYSHYSYGAVGGFLCGSMANPIALDFLNTSAKDDLPTVSYATVYPLAMFLRVIIAQLVVSILLS